MKKAFAIYGSVESCLELKFEANSTLVVVLAESIEKAAQIIGGRLEKTEGGILIWFPWTNFTEIWSGQEYQIEKVSETKDAIRGKFETRRWHLKNRIIESFAIDPIGRNSTTKHFGFAICEVPAMEGE